MRDIETYAALAFCLVVVACGVFVTLRHPLGEAPHDGTPPTRVERVANNRDETVRLYVLKRGEEPLLVGELDPGESRAVVLFSDERVETTVLR